jgi:hypothetical protein
MGQSLAALQAEAAAMSLMTAQALPQAAASAQSMARTTAQLLEGLQRVLADLRPQALDRLGLPVALTSLVGQTRRRADGSTLQASWICRPICRPCRRTTMCMSTASSRKGSPTPCGMVTRVGRRCVWPGSRGLEYRGDR